MKTEVKFDYGNLRDALNQYERATKKEIPDILNRTGRNIAFRSASFTSKATKARIRRDVKRIVSQSKHRRTSGDPKKRAAFKKGIEALIQRRINAIGYVRSGWGPAVEKLGGSFRGMKTNKGGATKATIARFITEIFNTVPGIEEIGVETLQKAIDYVAKDMLEEAHRRFQRIANRHG